MTSLEREAEILDKVRQSLIAEGYEVVVEPNSLLLPTFLQGFRPDALAYRADKNLVVEVSTQSPLAEKRLKKLQELVSSQREWELRLIWTSKDSSSRSPQQSTPTAIRRTLVEIEQLIAADQPKAGLLLGWAAFESIGRSIQPENLAKPQTPARLVEQLAMAGIVLPAEADELRALIPKRNRLIHGELSIDVRKRDVVSLVTILRRLLDSLPEA